MRVLKLSKVQEEWVDQEGKIVYIKGVPVSKRGGLTYIEWLEAKDMQSGSSVTDSNGIRYIAPFILTY